MCDGVASGAFKVLVLAWVDTIAVVVKVMTMVRGCVERVCIEKRVC